MLPKQLFFAAMAFTSLVPEVVAYEGGDLWCYSTPPKDKRGIYGSKVVPCAPLNAQDPDDDRSFCSRQCDKLCPSCPASSAGPLFVGCLVSTVPGNSHLTRCFCGGPVGKKNPPGCQ
ncbi:unnamed protein product [Zymoseptoria tritici ST99CH_3D7]|uniref:4Fe-4S ferredoxin-type domain-containing protein n=1 Tax=Zymoseptoria tritici (strain ST99CH_3D7) TaxID=1276538 RepID=A0A1X7RVS2_ZYMT9|nr:unnamed protein product [Zymoseptoria tritici ST99CH_3D7]